MENNLDKYFKAKLHDRKFEMKEEYWLGAEKMLDAQDNRRKRRVIFWWFGGGLGTLLLVGFGIWIFGKNEAQTPVVADSHIATKSPEKEVSPSQNSATKPLDKAENETPESPISNINNSPNIQNHSKTTNQQRSANQIDEENIARSLSSKSKVKHAGINIANDNKPHAQTGNEKSGISSINGNNSVEITASKGIKDEAKKILNSSAKVNEEAEKEQGISPDFLATLPYFVIGDFGENDLATTVQKIDVANPRRLHIGLLASQLLLPNAGKDEKTFAGQQFGLVLRYDFKNEFYLSSGLQYLHRTGTFDASKSATQRNYRFGLELDTLLLRPTSLHYFSLPILLGWEHNRHQLEAGVRLDFLTGVRGETGSYQKQGEPPVKVFKATQSGWITADGYRNFTPTFQLNYRYKIFNRWSIGIAANYTMRGVLDPNYEAPIGSFLLKETEKFQLGAHLVYFLN